MSNLSSNNSKKPYNIKIYENLHTLETQILIRNDNRRKSGIYCIRNIINGHLYIGSAITDRINTRFRNHCIHLSGSSLLNKAIKKYDLNNFQFLILEYNPGIVLKENQKKSHIKLIELETEYINYYKPEYNILSVGYSSLGYKHSEETKNIMKLNYSLERKLFITNLNKHKVYSEEERYKFRLLILERYNNQPNLKLIISKALSKPVILYNIDNTIHSEYSSVRNMAKHFKCCHKTINKYIFNQSIFKTIGIIKYKTIF